MNEQAYNMDEIQATVDQLEEVLLRTADADAEAWKDLMEGLRRKLSSLNRVVNVAVAVGVRAVEGVDE